MNQATAVSTMRMTVTLPPQSSEPEASALDFDAAAGGCGWFDSSFELRHGLEVIELGAIDAGFF
jgi:hypothetical protein